ncbi:ATP-binding protein [Thalassobaculum sp.]|uniref:PAS domain-containing sensor histidine kinase n=1 Tax=Thalassobaculum sp. TaxID=2022740 RepID=UPI0032EDAABF
MAHGDDDRAQTGQRTGRDVENEINRRIFETSLDLILVVGRQGDFIRVSPSVRKILGYAPEDLVGRNGVDFVHPADIENTRSEMRLGRLGREMRNFDCRYLHKNGSAVPLSWTGVWSEPEQQHFYIGRDMTEREAAEARVRHAQRLEAVGQLTGGIAHDFNNLLGVIIGSLDLLTETTDLAPGDQELVDVALNAALRGAKLTTQLLAFARRQSLDPEEFDANERVAQTLDLLRRTLGERIVVSTVLAGDLARAFADAAQFESALVNLAINARDAMPGGGRLVIETANQHLDDGYAASNLDVIPGRYVMLAVTDTGTGMPPDVAARAFEPFFTTKEAGGGSGLGLSMIYGYAKQSRGHIKIYSEPGRGTTVRLYLPAARGDGARHQPDEPTRLSSKAGGERILVVEDDEGVRTIALKQLQSLGYQVVTADNADAALRILKSDQELDLLFSDVVMPGDLTGDELSRIAVTLRPGLKTLLTSGFASGAAQNGTQSEDFRTLLSKPYRLVDLAKRLREILDG